MGAGGAALLQKGRQLDRTTKPPPLAAVEPHTGRSTPHQFTHARTGSLVAGEPFSGPRGTSRNSCSDRPLGSPTGVQETQGRPSGVGCKEGDLFQQLLDFDLGLCNHHQILFDRNFVLPLLGILLQSLMQLLVTAIQQGRPQPEGDATRRGRAGDKGFSVCPAPPRAVPHK